MQTNENDIKNLSEYGIQISLSLLMKANLLLEKKINSDDTHGAEIIEKQIIPKYEKIYNFLQLDNFTKSCNENNLVFSKTQEILDNLLKENKLSEKNILSQIKKKKEFHKKSGADVVKKFYKFQIKEYNNLKVNLISIVQKKIDKELSLNTELGNTVQEQEQILVLNELISTEKERKDIERKIENYDKIIQNYKSKLEKKWTYEIYSHLPEEEFMKVFNNFFYKT